MEKASYTHTNAGTPSPKDRFDFLLATGVIVILVAAWILGLQRSESDIQPFLERVFPMADRFVALSDITYSAWNKDSPDPIGYVGISTAEGYGGELKVVVAVSLEGRILSSVIFSHRETASYFDRVQEGDILSRFVDKAGGDTFIVNQDVDGVTGATVTSQALADAARRAVRIVSIQALSLPVPDEPSPELQFGWPEIVLILFFLSAILLQRRDVRWKRALRYSSLVTGLVVIGFLLNKPLNLVIINKFFLGAWPALETNLYWYILLVGSLLFILIGGTNTYCNSICPFGAAQEFLGILGRGRPPSYRFNIILKWIQRCLALVLIALALIYRNPSVNNYEVSGTLFQFIGTSFHFGLLGAVIIASLFVQRFWCRGICPVRPVADSLQWIQRKVRHPASDRCFSGKGCRKEKIDC
jgi:NosR/NirI family nitrous oxide reductase transcriptional regulator